MFKKICWRILVVLFLILGQFANVESVSALGTPEIVSISPPSGSQVGSNVCIRARVAWDSDFRSMRIRFGNEGWNESAEIEFERCFGTGHLGAGWYTIRVEVAKVNEDWNTATATEIGYELTAPPPPAGPSRGPNISVFSFSPESATVGDNVNIRVRVDSNNPGATTITVGCGGITKNETAEVEFDSNWNTSSCGDGNINVKVCSRATDDPNWSNATCSDRNYYLAPKQVAVPAPTADLWVDSDNITTGSCTYLRWSTSNATSAEIDGASVNLTGEMQVCPPVTKKYSFSVNGSGGNASRNLTVVVSGSPQSPNVADYFSTKDLIDINGNLFVIVNGEKRHIPNPETLDALGLSRGMIISNGFSASDLDKIPTSRKDVPDVLRDKAGFDAFKAKYFAELSPIVPNQGSTIIEPPTGGQVEIIPNGPQGLASDGECPASPTVLTVGSQAEIADRDLNLRPRPNVNTKELTVIPNFAQVTVVDGPRCKQEVRWYKVEYKGVQGWAAEVGTGGEYHMYPVVVVQPVATEVPQTEIPLVVTVPTVPEPATSGVSPLVDTGCDELATGQWWNPFNPPDVGAMEQCTDYVARVNAEVYKCWKGAFPSGGFWDDWANDPNKSGTCGWTVTNDFSTAKQGDIVTWNPASQNSGVSCEKANPKYGHVAIFQELNDDGTIKVGESNWDRDHNNIRVNPNCMSIVHMPTIAVETPAPSTPAPTTQVDKCSQYTWPKSWFCKWGWIK